MGGSPAAPVSAALPNGLPSTAPEALAWHELSVHLPRFELGVEHHAIA